MKIKVKSKIYFAISGLFIVLFGALTFLVLNVDVQPIGPEGSAVGLSKINGALHDAIGSHMEWYGVTSVLGIVGILSTLGFALLGLIELITRKSFSKVDKDLYVLGAFCVLTAVLYFTFELIIINYRPVLIDGALEASFPSSHTMLICFTMGTAMAQTRSRIKNKGLMISAQIVAVAIMAVTVVGRFVSGVHWFTDIIGGLLLGGAIVTLYLACVSLLTKKENSSLTHED